MTCEIDNAIKLINQIRKNLKDFFYYCSYTDKSDDFIDDLQNLINGYDFDNKINENQQNLSKKAEKISIYIQPSFSLKIEIRLE